MFGTCVRQAAGPINSGVLLIPRLFTILILLCVPPSLAQSDQGFRRDHDVARVSEEPVSVANLKASVDASKMRNIVGCRGLGIHTSVHDDNLVNPKVVESRAEAAAWVGQSTLKFNLFSVCVSESAAITGDLSGFAAIHSENAVKEESFWGKRELLFMASFPARGVLCDLPDPTSSCIRDCSLNRSHRGCNIPKFKCRPNIRSIRQ